MIFVKQRDFIDQYRSIIIGIVFICMAWVGLNGYKDYGISYDEPDTLYNIKVTTEYIQNIIANKIFDVELDTEEYDHYIWASNGCTIRLPIYLIAQIRNMDTSSAQYYRWSHFYCYMIFFLAMIFFYKLLRIIFVSQWLSLAGVIILFLSPRILGEAFYNLKDNNFLSIFVINIYFWAMAYLKPKKWNLFLFCFVSALCINTRIFGGIIFGVGIVLLSAKKRGMFSKFVFFIKYSLIAFGLFYLITPFLWTKLFPHLMILIKNNVSFPWIGSMLFEGEIIMSIDLPWYYLIQWIIITTPIVFIIFSFLGLIVCLVDCYKRIREKKIVEEKQIKFVCIGVLIFIILVDIVIKPVDYDEWRHFRFLYPLIVILMVEAISFIQKKRRISLVMLLIFGIQIGYLVFWNIFYHPYQYMYFNILSKTHAEEKYERDYWYVSIYDAVEYIIRSESEKEYKIAAPLPIAFYLLSDEQKENVFFTDLEDCIYYIDTWRTRIPLEAKQDYESQGWKLIKEKKVDGIIMYDIYKK